MSDEHRKLAEYPALLVNFFFIFEEKKSKKNLMFFAYVTPTTPMSFLKKSANLF